MPFVTGQYPSTFSLGNLNGQNGITFTGVNSNENINEHRGVSVSSAHDLNEDGIANVIIAIKCSPCKLRSIM